MIIYAIDIRDKTDLDEISYYVQEEKKRKVKLFANVDDKKRSIYGDLMIRYLISKKLQIKNSKIKFASNKFGKPFIEGFGNIHFNISHSEHWVIGAVDSYPIGIDIERMEYIENIDEISKRFFSNEEIKYIESQKSYSEKIKCFYKMWTLKESYLKSIGKGLTKRLSSFSLEVIKDKVVLSDQSEIKNDYYFNHFIYNHNYYISVCMQSNILSRNIKILDINDIINYLRTNV